MTIALILIAISYLVLIIILIYGFGKVEEFHLTEKSPKGKFSVIIPFRNEEQHLPLLLASISELNYPKSLFEFLFIDDFSADNSAKTIKKFFKNRDISYRLIENHLQSKSPKKDAITLGIKEANYERIITTDADCILPKYWLDSFDAYLQLNNSDLIIGPVEIYNSTTFLDRFQALDFLSLQASCIGGVGIGRPFLCNGANLCYSKELFNNINGFKGNEELASGDDIFLLQKTVKDKSNKIGYLKSEHAIVKTSAQPQRKSLIAQRVRWASKTKRYNSNFAKLVGLLVFLMNASLLVGIVLVLIETLSPKMFFYIFVIKISIDFLLIFKAARFFNSENLMLSYIVSCIVYPFFTVYVAVISSFGGYKWKDRQFKS